MLERAGQSLQLGRRWLPGRALVFVAARSFAAREWRAWVARWPGGSVLTRLRLDAALSDPPPPRAPRQTGRPRLTGNRRPTLAAVLADEQTPWSTLTGDDWYGEGPRAVEVATDTAVWSHTGKPPVALRWGLMRAPHERFTPPAWWSTNGAPTCAPRLAWFVRRWTLEVTVEAARAPLGLATPRQGNDRAIARATPALWSLYSLITLTAHLLIAKEATGVRSPAWYRKTRPTFSDAMALGRRHLWNHLHFSMSQQETDMIKIPRVLLERFTEALCYAA